MTSKHKQTNTPLKRKVFVGMSGGVDSSVSAALLKKEGYDVTGVFIKVWQPDWIDCNWKEDRLDAMRVAAKLEIPFVTLDLEKEYKKEVVDYMIAEYKAGRTPNPDVMCNRHVKFGAFFDWAMKQGADFVATGHYAKTEAVSVERLGDSKDRKNLNAIRYTLNAGFDSNKDQSYFLWTLTQRELSKTLFPVGHLQKPEVRKIAEKLNLITANKKDSQGLCFIGKIDMKDFLKEFIKPKIGNVVNEEGEIIGNHDGAVFFTLGERHGFTITKKTPHDGPYFVTSKNINNNELVVSHKNADETLPDARKEIMLDNVNWIAGTAPDPKKTYLARSRYRQPLQTCHLEAGLPSTWRQGLQVRVVFALLQNSLSPGQSLVIYDEEVCIGGGIIV